MDTNVIELIKHLKSLECRLYLESDKLKLDIAKGVLTEELKVQISANKDQLIKYLTDLEEDEKEIVKVPEKETYTASFGQRRLWILSQFEEVSVTYNIPVSLQLNGIYDVDNLRKAISAAIQRHEILRTTFVLDDLNQIEQRILTIDELGFTMGYEDYRGASNPDTLAQDYILKDQYKPFDLKNGPLLRASLLQLADDSYVFYYNMHHIISDGWSMEILTRDVFAFYELYTTKKSNNLPKLEIQYKDYAAWQAKKVKRATGSLDRAYWLERFSGDIPLLDFPRNTPRPKVKKYKGDCFGIVLSNEITADIQSFTQELGGSKFMVLLAAWNVLCYHYTSQKDIVIGIPVSGREHPDLENQIGFFLNTIALRNKIDPQEHFVDFYKKVKETTLEAYSHQNYPFDLLVEELELHRDISRSPIFDVLIDYHGVASESMVNSNTGEITSMSSSTVKFDLELHFYEVNDTIELLLKYNTDIYEASLIRKLIGHFKKIVSQINDISVIGEFNTLDANDQQFLEDYAIGEEVPLEYTTIVECFQEQAANYANNTGLVWGEKSMSFDELDSVSNQVAYGLINDYNVQPSDVVGIILDPNQWSIISILGILKTGATYVFVDPNLPQDRKYYILEDSKAKLVITTTNYVFDLSGFAGELFSIDVEFDTSWDKTRVNLSDVSGLAYIIYTSGSTGTPKGVKISHKSLSNYLQWAKNYYSENGNVNLNFGLFTTLSFDLTITSVFLPLITGNTLTLLEHKESAQMLKSYFESQINCIKLTPAHIGLLSSLDIDKSSIEVAIVGGDVLSSHHVDTLKRINPKVKIYNEYGPTEFTVGCIVHAVDQVEIGTTISIGNPIHNTKVYILNEMLQPQPIGVEGEIYLAGLGLAEGYNGQPELTNEKFIEKSGERLYKTGDIGKWDTNGTLRYIGRIDNQVKIKGYRIEIDEIISCLSEKPSIQDATVIVKDSNNEEKELIGYIVSEVEENVTALQNFLSVKLPKYMIPSYFVQLDAIPQTVNGKVDKNNLPSPKDFQLSTGVAYVAPSNFVEEVIVNVWQEELQRKTVGIDDDYFALGGDSIKAIGIIIKINKVLEVTIGVSDLYVNSTIRTLSAFISENNLFDKKNNDTDGYQIIKDFQTQIEDTYHDILPANYEVIYPLVPVEEGMIYSSLLREDEPMYYDRFVYIVEIEDMASLKEAMKTLIDRHSILRTRYFMESFDTPVKIVLKEIDIPMEFLDFRKKSKQELAKALNEIKENDMKKRLTFDNEFLYNFTFIQINDKEYYVIWNFHHAVLDGWSTSVFTQELTVLLGKEEKKELPKLPYSYVDYCATVLSRKTSESTIQYWKDLLDGYSRNKLPFNFKGTKVSDEKGMKILELDLNQDTLLRLEKLSEDLQVSFKAICLAAHTFLLRVICSEKDVVTGVVSHERPELEQSDRIVGCFLNTVPVRVNFEKIDDVVSLIHHVNEYLIHSKEHEVHVSDIANFIEEKTTLGNPIFDTLLNYTHFHVYDLVERNASISETTAEIEGELLDPEEMTNTLFDVEISRNPSMLRLRVKYVPSFFTDQDAQDTLDILARILKRFPEKGLLNSEMTMDKKEVKELLYDYNNTVLKEDNNIGIHQLFEKQVLLTPNNIALRQNGKELSYSELNDKANEVAHYLINKGVVAETNIGLLCTRSFDMIIALLGILKASGSYVPIDPNYPLHRQQYIANNSNVGVVLTNYRGELMKSLGDTEFILVSETLNSGLKNNPEISIKGEQLAYTIYTSGSTGNPKGVMIEHYSAVNLIRWVNETFSIDQSDRLLFVTSVCFDLSVYDIFGILASGASVVIATKEEVQDFGKLKELLINERITFWDSVPTTFNYLVGELEEDGDEYLPDLRLAFMSGDWIPVELPERAKKIFPNVEVISLGGATEGTVWSNYFPINKVDEHWSSIPYGKPIRNNFFYILDDHLIPVPKGTVGELFIGGIGVARGYDNDQFKTDSAFMKDPFSNALGGRMYKTGDLGSWKRDGNMEFIGRKDNQVKIRGFRVELGEIESVLLKHTSIKEAIVNVIIDKNGQNQLCAYLVAQNDYDNEDLRTYLGDLLPEYMIPGYYMVLENLPLNSNGKIDRKALPEPTLKNTKEQVFISSVTPIEKAIEEVWKGILNMEQISMNDNLFDLGVYSLSVASFVARFHKRMQYKLSIGDIFHNPTIGELAKFVSGIKKRKYKEITKAEEQESYPLSEAQKGLWVLDQFEDGALAYNVGFSIPLEYANFSIKRFETSLNTLIKRHESLRTVFREDENGEARQWILSPEELGFKIKYQDLREKEYPEKIIDRYNKKEAGTRYDLQNGPLLRVCLFQLSENEYVLCFGIHHIIIDGWSLHLAFEETMKYYHSSESESFSELKIQYKDYVQWQLNNLKDGSFDEIKKYWMNLLSGALPTLNLPTNKKRPAIKTYNGETLSTYLSVKLSNQIKNYVAENKGTAFMGFLASFNAMFYHYTGQTDIILGSVFSGREHSEMEDQIGFYGNTVALRNTFNKEESFDQLFKRIKQTTLTALENENYPFERLIDDLDVKVDPSRSYIFDVMLVLQKRRETLDIEKNDSFIYGDEIYVTGDNSSKYDFYIAVAESDNQINLKIEYNTDVYERELVEKFIVDYKWFLEKLLEEPGTSMSQLDFLSQKEKEKVLIDFNNTNVSYNDTNVINLFYDQVSKTPNAVAVTFDDTSLTYQELNEKSNQFANYLKNVHDIGLNDLIGLRLEQSEKLIIAILGVLKIGAAYVPIDTSYPKKRAQLILDDSKCKTCINSNMIRDFESQQGALNNDNIPVTISSNTLAYIIYTSGTTGTPKGAMIEHSALHNYIQYSINAYTDNSPLRFALFTSISFDLTVTSIFTPLCSGGAIKVLPSLERKLEILEMVTNDDFDVVKLTPSHINVILDSFIQKNVDGKGGKKKVFIIGGEPLLRETVDRLYDFYGDRITIWNEYGPTESTVGCISKKLEQNYKYPFVPIGKPTSNVKAYVLDSSKRIVPVGVEGELYLGGKQLAKGYLNREELTKEKFLNLPNLSEELLYKTGDIVKWLPDGDIHYIGRKDDQVKIRGHRIELKEIENIISKEDFVKEVAVSVNEINENIHITAYLVVSDGFDKEQLRNALEMTLPNYMIPDFYIEIPVIPLTINGKVNYTELPAVTYQNLPQKEYIAPVSDVEKQLVMIWGQILAVEKIGITDKFSELGGHSLKLLRLKNEYHKHFNLSITLGELYEKTTIQETAAYIEFLLNQTSLDMEELTEIEI